MNSENVKAVTDEIANEQAENEKEYEEDTENE